MLTLMLTFFHQLKLLGATGRCSVANTYIGLTAFLLTLSTLCKLKRSFFLRMNTHWQECTDMLPPFSTVLNLICCLNGINLRTKRRYIYIYIFLEASPLCTSILHALMYINIEVHLNF
jgi:hypothetical protein